MFGLYSFNEVYSEAGGGRDWRRWIEKELCHQLVPFPSVYILCRQSLGFSNTDLDLKSEYVRAQTLTTNYLEDTRLAKQESVHSEHASSALGEAMSVLFDRQCANSGDDRSVGFFSRNSEMMQAIGIVLVKD
jgi:hypothetical protein